MVRRSKLDFEKIDEISELFSQRGPALSAKEFVARVIVPRIKKMRWGFRKHLAVQAIIRQGGLAPDEIEAMEKAFGPGKEGHK